MDELKFELTDITDINTYKEYEQERKENEQQRIENEQLRETQESQRQSNESERQSQEQERVNSESLRMQEETKRVNAEELRITAETARQQYYQEIQQKVNNGDFNGRGIVNTEKISTEGLVDIYRINYTDGQNPDTFTVKNGTDGSGGSSSGDMLKSTYDTNNNGIVDNSEKLNNQSADYYLNYNNFTNTPIVPTTTNELTNNSDFTTKNYVDEIFETKSNVSNTYATKIDVANNYATKSEATYTAVDSTTIDMILSNNQISAEVNNGSITEAKLSAELATKINEKQDSDTALLFYVEEEIE